MNEQHFKRNTWEEGLPCSSSGSRLLGRAMTTNQHASKLPPTHGEAPINIRRNSNQLMARLLPTYGETPNNIRSNSGQHPSKLRTTSIPIPDNIRPNYGQHPFQLRTRDDRTEQPQTFRGLCLSRDEGLPNLHNIFSVRVFFQSLLCKCFPSTNGNCVLFSQSPSFLIVST